MMIPDGRQIVYWEWYKGVWIGGAVWRMPVTCPLPVDPEEQRRCEIVDYAIPGATEGDTEDWVQGRFVGGNLGLDKSIQMISRHPYDKGWLYEVEGEPDPKSLSVEEYVSLLDVAIDKILEQQKNEETS